MLLITLFIIKNLSKWKIWPVELQTLSNCSVLLYVETPSDVSIKLHFITGKTERCEPTPCFNGAICIPTNDSYKCNCQDGYSGYKCESE